MGSSEEPAAAGAILEERYRITSLLGRGAMGCVYLAEDLKLRRHVALKIVRPEALAEPNIRQRIDNECRAMARLEPHRHIVTLHDRIEYRGCAVLVMEFVNGESLAAILRRLAHLNSAETVRVTTMPGGKIASALTRDEAIEIIVQVLDALAYIHSRNLIHRDIKPGNILLTRDHEGNLIAKVTDFGIAEELQNGHKALTRRTSPGTPAYMAPEQVDAKRYGALTAASDLYAVGVILFELLTRRLPFQGTYTQLLEAHTDLEPPRPRSINPTVPVELEDVVLRALAKQPQQRYSSAATFKIDLQSAGDGTIATPRQWHSSRSQIPWRRLGVAAVLLCTAVAGASAYFAWRALPQSSEIVNQAETDEMHPEENAPSDAELQLAKDSNNEALSDEILADMPCVIAVEALGLSSSDAFTAMGEFRVTNLSPLDLGQVALKIQVLDNAGKKISEGVLPLSEAKTYQSAVRTVIFPNTPADRAAGWKPVISKVTDTKGANITDAFTVQAVAPTPAPSAAPTMPPTQDGASAFELHQRSVQFWKSRQPVTSSGSSFATSRGRAYVNTATGVYHLKPNCIFGSGDQSMTPLGAVDAGYRRCGACG